MPTYMFKFGTLDLSDAVDEFSEAIDTRLNAMQVPKRHGVLITEAPVLAGRVIRVKGRVQAINYEILRGTMDTIGRILNSGRQQLRICDDRYINAYKQSFGFGFVPGAALCAADFSIDFIADDPFWYEDDPETQEVELLDTDTSVGGGNYLKSFQLTNGGEAFVYLKVTVTADQGGSVDKVVVRDTTHGRAFEWHGTLASGKSLVIDSNNFTVLNDGADDLTNWSGHFISLDKCTATMEIEGKPATYLFEWTHRYY